MDIPEFAAAMAEYLDGTWAVEAGYHGHRDRCLIGPDGEQLHLCYSGWEKTPRLRLSASLPDDLAVIRHRHGNPVPLHEITVSPSKTPAVVAAETVRRLLPAYRVTLAESRALKQRLDDQAAARDRLAYAIADRLGASVHHPRPAARGCDPQEAIVRYTGALTGTATVPRNGDRVTFAFSVVSGHAAEVAAFLATFRLSDRATEPEQDRTPPPRNSDTGPDTDPGSFSRDQVARAVNEGANLLINGLRTSERDQDLINLLVNTALTRLDNPAADLDQVITDCYQREPAEVRGWCTPA